nr:MAG TPA: hypothetical protein [Caudoviricetes sp.]
MLSFIIKFFELFTKLPESVQNQIINAVIDTLSFVFKRFFKNKNAEDLKTATDEAVTPKQWHGTAVAVSSLVPSIYSQKKKDEFADSVIKLVKSNEFINQLSNRIDKIDAQDEETYVALCSIETKKLIIEMLDKVNK